MDMASNTYLFIYFPSFYAYVGCDVVVVVVVVLLLVS